MVDKQCAFFSIADNYHYVPMVITALCSIRRFHPNQDYFVLGRFKHDKKALNLLENHNIQYIHIDLSQVFDDITIVHPESLEIRTWPSEVNWWPYVHTLLLKRDYPHSCYVDGDMLCVGDLELDGILRDTKHISAVSKPDGELNSGMIIMNNKELTEFKFWERYRELYETHRASEHQDDSNGCWFCTDQPLFDEIVKRFKMESSWESVQPHNHKKI